MEPGNRVDSIMIIDDDHENLRMLDTMLTQQGYIVRTFPAGPAALRSAHMKAPDLILLDIRMPEMDGFEVCRRLKASDDLRDVPVLFLSAVDEIHEKVRAFELGGIDFITKPFQSEEVLARVSTQLTIRRYQNELEEKTNLLSEQKRMYSRLIKNIGDEYVVFSHTPEGIFTYMSPGSKELFGKEPQELIGTNWRDLNPTDESLSYHDEVDKKQVATGNAPPTSLFHYYHSDNSVHTLECENVPVLDETGRVIMIDGIAKDITKRLQLEKNLKIANERLEDMNVVLEQRIRERTADLIESNLILKQQIEERLAAEQALQVSEEKYRRIVTTANEGIATTDNEFRIVYANKIMAELLGGSVEAIVGRQSIDFIHAEDREIIRKRFNQRKRGKHQVYECRIRRLDGVTIWVIVCAAPIMDRYNKFQGSIVLFTDITDRKRKEVELRNAYQEIIKLKNQIEADKKYLQEEIKLEHNFDQIIGNSDEIKYSLFRLEQVAETDAAVIILGETGTGKELFARALHSTSARAARPLIKVNCATLSEQLIESELFGHVKGAFTGANNDRQGRFELADGGTLFLDEIGELSSTMQAKLLRVLQDGEFEKLGDSRTIKTDVRLITATNRNLEAMVKAGKFRKDLWYRLNVFPITLPPLRTRKNDIPLLVNYFIKKTGKKIGKEISQFPKSVLDELTAYDWPGNVRELEHVLERAIIVSRQGRLQLTDRLVSAVDEPHNDAFQSHSDVEREHILRVLEQTGWIIQGPKGAAKILDLHPNTLRYRMKKLGIRRPV